MNISINSWAEKDYLFVDLRTRHTGDVNSWSSHFLRLKVMKGELLQYTGKHVHTLRKIREVNGRDCKRIFNKCLFVRDLQVFMIRLKIFLGTPWKWNVINYVQCQGMYKVAFPFTNGLVM